MIQALVYRSLSGRLLLSNRGTSGCYSPGGAPATPPMQSWCQSAGKKNGHLAAEVKEVLRVLFCSSRTSGRDNEYGPEELKVVGARHHQKAPKFEAVKATVNRRNPKKILPGRKTTLLVARNKLNTVTGNVPRIFSG